MDPSDMRTTRKPIGLINTAGEPPNWRPPTPLPVAAPNRHPPPPTELPLQTVVRTRRIQHSEETCFIDESTRQRRCAHPELGVPVAGGAALPLALGVGPAMTGGAPLFETLLGAHPAILLGDSTQRGHRCCGSELYFFSRRFPGANDGPLAAALAAYFPADAKPEARWLAEATPEYSDHFLAPYRLRATLQPGATALVFTVRDPLDAHAALYLHRAERKGEVPTPKGFLDWSLGLLNGDLTFQRCAADEAARGTPGSSSKLPVLRLGVTPDWVGDQAADEAIFEACRAPAFRPADRLEGVGSLAYSRSMPRWREALDEGVRGVCVFYGDLVADAAHEGRRVAEALGLDPDLVPDVDLGEALEPEGVATARVLAAAEGGDAATAGAVRWHLARLRYQFAGEMEFAREFCAQL